MRASSFLYQVWISQRGAGSALVSAQRSVNVAQQDDSGIFWGFVREADAPRGCDVFVPEAFKDNRSS